MEYYTIIKRNEPNFSVSSWIDPQNIWKRQKWEKQEQWITLGKKNLKAHITIPNICKNIKSELKVYALNSW